MSLLTCQPAGPVVPHSHTQYGQVSPHLWCPGIESTPPHRRTSATNRVCLPPLQAAAALIYVTSSMVTLALDPIQSPFAPIFAIKRSSYVTRKVRTYGYIYIVNGGRGGRVSHVKWFISGNWCHSVPKKRKGFSSPHPAFHPPSSRLPGTPLFRSSLLIILILNLLKLTNDFRRQHCVGSKETGCQWRLPRISRVEFFNSAFSVFLVVVSLSFWATRAISFELGFGLNVTHLCS